MPQLPVILTAFANSYDADYLVHLEQEHDRLQQILLPLSYLRHVPLSSAKSGQLVSTLTQCQQELLIFHFGGHADGEQLQFRDAGGQVAGLAENLSLHPQLKLVFLNGCNTQAQAVQYLDAGVPAVVATTCSVADGQAMQFAEVFYNALAKGHTLEEAFVRAKGAMKLSGATPMGEEIMNLRGVRLRQEQVTELPWRLYVAGDEVLSWTLEMVSSKVKSLPILLNNVPTNFDPKTDCLGRETELAELHQKLSNSPKVALVRGLGGIGKTTLVQAYVALYQKHYQHMIWVTQGSDLVRTIAFDRSLGQSLKLPFQVDEDLETRFVQLMQTLRTIPGPNLLVIDNATEQVAQRDTVHQLPNAPNWKVLVTSRQDLPDFAVLELRELEPDAALKLFRLYYQGGADEETMQLLEEINYHTLMIELMAKTLNKKRGVLSIPQLLNNFRNRQLDDPMLAEKIWTRHSGQEREVFNCLMCLYELVDLSEKEIWVLQQFTVLPTLPIEATLLANWLKIDENELIHTLNELADRGWLSTKGNSFVIHRIVQEVIKYKKLPGIIELGALVDTMAKKMAQTDYGNLIHDNVPWLPYAETLAAHFKSLDLLPIEVATLWNNIALIFSELNQFKLAEPMLGKALFSFIKNYGNNDPNVITLQVNLGLALNGMGLYQPAYDLIAPCLQNDLSFYDQNHLNVIRSKSALASVLFNQEKLEQSAQLFEEVLTSELMYFPPTHPNIARAQSNLSGIYLATGNKLRAKELAETALASDTNNFGIHHPTVANRQSNLSLVLISLEDYNTAISLLDSAYQTYVKHFGRNHPKVSTVLANIAKVLKDTGQYLNAKKIMSQALEIDITHYGYDHPKVASGKAILAFIILPLGEYLDAVKYLEHVIDIIEKTFGSKHIKLAQGQYKLAKVYFDGKEYEKSKIFLERAKAIVKNELGVDHPNYKAINDNLDEVNQKLNNGH